MNLCVVEIGPATERSQDKWVTCNEFVRFHRDLAFDMSDGPKGAKRPLERPLVGGVRRHAQEPEQHGVRAQQWGAEVLRESHSHRYGTSRRGLREPVLRAQTSDRALHPNIDGLPRGQDEDLIVEAIHVE